MLTLPTARKPLYSVVAVALLAACIFGSRAASAEKVSNTRLYISPPSNCKQNAEDNWIQCRSANGEPLTQFYIVVGNAGREKYKKYWTQETLISIRDSDIATTEFEPVVSFRDSVAQWANEAISDGGQITQPFEYGFIKNEQGVMMLYSLWNYKNAHDVELLSGFYQIWDRGQAISVMSNLPMNLGDATDKSVLMVGETLKSIDLR